jgi:hypothetical protein
MAYPMASVVGTDGKSRVFFVDGNGELERYIIDKEPESPRDSRYNKEVLNVNTKPVKISGKFIAAVAYNWNTVHSVSIRSYRLCKTSILTGDRFVYFMSTIQRNCKNFAKMALTIGPWAL